MQNKNRERKTYLERQQLEAKWRKTTGCCSWRKPLLAVHGGARLAGCCRCLFQARLQTKREMVACWLVDISPLFLVLVLEGKDGFCWFCYCDWGKVWLLLVPSGFECYQACGAELREKKKWMESPFWGGCVGCVDREGRPVNGVYDGCRLGEWGLAKGLQPIERDEEVVTGCSKSAKTGEERLVSGCLWRIAGEWGKKRWRAKSWGVSFGFFPREGGVCFVFKKDERGGRVRFRPVEKNRFRVLFFFSWLPQIFSLKIVLCKFSPPHVYSWMFTYIENLYTFYLRKYCNNYYRDCLL